MPLAVLKVNNLTGVIVNDFHLSAPTDLVDRVMSMISNVGLHPQAQAQEGTDVGHIKIEGEFSLFGRGEGRMNIIWKGRQVECGFKHRRRRRRRRSFGCISVSTPVLTQPHLSASFMTSAPPLDYNQGVELHTLLNWIENSAWNLVHTSETAVSQSACNHTFIFKKVTFMDR